MGAGAAFLSKLEDMAGRHAVVAMRRELLARVAPLLDALPPSRPLDAILHHNSGYLAVNGLADGLGLVMDPHGPALGGEGEGGEFTLLIHDIQEISPDPHRGGINILLETGEALWLGLF